MKLVPVAPAMPLDPNVDVREVVLLADVWIWVREAVAKMLIDGDYEMLPDDVYRLIRDGGATLFLMRADEDLGFVIVQRQIELIGSATMLIWFLWSKPLAMREFHHEVQEQLNAIARVARCTKLRMHTSRSERGWQRLGWKPKQVIFEREL